MDKPRQPGGWRLVCCQMLGSPATLELPFLDVSESLDLLSRPGSPIWAMAGGLAKSRHWRWDAPWDLCEALERAEAGLSEGHVLEVGSVRDGDGDRSQGVGTRRDHHKDHHQDHHQKWKEGLSKLASKWFQLEDGNLHNGKASIS